MTKANHQIVRNFLDAMTAGNITDDLVTPDFKVWVVADENLHDKETYASGIANLPKIFPNKLIFTIKSLTAEDDRVVAEFSGDGTMASGTVYQNDYLYLFKIRDGKVCFLAEYLNLDLMRGVLMPEMVRLLS